MCEKIEYLCHGRTACTTVSVGVALMRLNVICHSQWKLSTRKCEQNSPTVEPCLGAQKRYWSTDQLPHVWQCVTLNTQVTKLQIHTCLNDVKECWPFIEKLWNLWLLENLLSPEGECTLHLFLDEGLIPFLLFYLKWNETSLSLYSKDTCITRYDEKLSAMVHNTIGNRNINNMIRG